MAIGDDATAQGYPLVPQTGEGGRLFHGADEINRTRDIIAEVAVTIPVGTSGFQTSTGITIGTDAPSGGSDGDIYFQVSG